MRWLESLIHDRAIYSWCPAICVTILSRIWLPALTVSLVLSQKIPADSDENRY